MSEPEKYNFKLYKGADFVLEIRFKEDDAYYDPGTVTFKASFAGTETFLYTSGGSPDYLTIDPDDSYLITLRIPGADTENVSVSEMFYQIDVTNDDGEIERKMIGTINVVESA